ncbi:hypothetical protein [Wenjunlia tyrosinilytica]|uniref:hypothetical protein n=1 Tax=Wenjunlia tyrosinilytica TaxID=1544741 RepID=UPI001E2D54BB|nr:hypothetical protein [Wenjunlia tyrosinilytica]
MLRLAVAVSSAGAALAAGVGAASAAPASSAGLPGLPDPGGVTRPDVGAALTGLQQGAPAALKPVKSMNINPLAQTGVDPLDNSVGTQAADFAPVSTAAATKPLATRNSLSTLPIAGPVAGVLPG